MTGETMTCACGGTFIARDDRQRYCNRSCGARFRRNTGKQLGRPQASSNWRKNQEDDRCRCAECVAGRAAALQRLAAKGIGPRKFTPEEFQKRMSGVSAARRQHDTYAWLD